VRSRVLVLDIENTGHEFKQPLHLLFGFEDSQELLLIYNANYVKHFNCRVYFNA